MMVMQFDFAASLLVAHYYGSYLFHNESIIELERFSNSFGREGRRGALG
jgi:hypothetical protein